MRSFASLRMTKKKAMPINRRSRHITEGVARAPNRSMYYALGYEEGDFAKPMIGVANGHSTITPCNSGLQKLADAALAGIEEAGGNAQVFGTPTISDGMAMGTEGMKYSLVSREVIADCVETCVQGQWMDGVVVIGGCDKNMPGGLMGMLRANVPAIYVYGGTILPGHYKGKDLNIVSVFEAVGENAAGRMSDEDLLQIERRAIPGTGSCGGMYTANTMSSAFEALGISLPYSSTMANPHDEKMNSAKESAKVLIEAIKKDLKPRDIVTHKSIENAVAVIMAIGGSTNAVLHFLAIAHAAGVEWTIDDFERMRVKVPVLCDLKPSGKYLAVDLHHAGGIPQVMKTLLAAGLLHGDCITITGKAIAENLAAVPSAARFSAMVLPVIVMQSPCSSPASSRTFITCGMPPTLCRSTARYLPEGFRSHSTGTLPRMRSKSSIVHSTPAVCAMARKCSTALVEPPVAMITATAFSMLFLVTMSRGLRSRRTASTSTRAAVFA